MVIDFHTHIFPDKIAHNALTKLSGLAKIKPFTLATRDSLIDSMKRAGIDISVVLNIATSPKQFDNVNAFAKEQNELPLISLGSIHPKNDNIKERICTIANMGLKGIKMHFEYQDTHILDDSSLEIFEECKNQGLFVVIHSGKDVAFGDACHAKPQDIATLLDTVKGVKIVAAHMGGFSVWDDVEKYLIGKDIYIDTSFTKGYLPREQMFRMVNNHNPKKVLFGSDSPWASQEEYVPYIDSFNFKNIDDIMSNNAKELLGMK